MAEENSIEIHLFSPGFEEFFLRYGQQIGHGEVFIETEETLPVDTPVVLIFQIVYEDLELIRANGAVFQVIDKDGKETPPAGGAHAHDSIPGMGIRLTDIDEAFRAYITELLKRQIRSDLSRMFTT